MMMDKRLLNVVPDSKKYIMRNVLCQWGALAANIVMMWNITALLASLLVPEPVNKVWAVIWIVLAVIVRYVCTILSSRMSYLSSKAVKKTLREKIYQKLLRLGVSYKEQVKTSENVQVAVEGVDQLETYFGAYLPQFFYAMIAPLTLFVVLCFVNVPSAIVLLVCVPMIPIAIAVVQTWAKKLLSKYWDQYTALGDTFLENLQGLTTLKIYQSDAYKNEQMNAESEKFRKITMKVLTMQLNSITIMDLVAYGGAALGMIMAVTQYRDYHIFLQGCLLIIVLSADFFIPMRQLGSFFHIAMNGMAASDKIFKLLDMPEQNQGEQEIGEDCTIVCSELSFGYEEDKEILHNISMSFPKGSFTAIVGESGSGKTTVIRAVLGALPGAGQVTSGDILFHGESLLKNSKSDWRKIRGSKMSMIFQDCGGTLNPIRKIGSQYVEYICTHEAMAKKDAWQRAVTMLSKMRLPDAENIMNSYPYQLSGGMRQRVGIAMAMTFNPELLLADEPTSALDVTTQAQIVRQMMELRDDFGTGIIIVTHNIGVAAYMADQLIVMHHGKVVDHGTREEVLNNPTSDYTKKLLDAVPEMEGKRYV